MAAVRMRIGVVALLALVLGGQAPRAHALTFSIDGTWDTDARKTAATNAMQAVVDRYNAYGNFNLNNDGVINVIYDSTVGTADANYNAVIRFGGTYPNERVAQHESNHWLGSGTTAAWTNRFDAAGNWTGAKMNALAAQFDGDGAVIKKSNVHFYPYGLNQDNEVVNSSVLMRNIALTYAQRQDDGLGTQTDPWSATTVALTQSDAIGTSAFNWFGNWSDNYFAHPAAAYSTGNFLIRTPLDTYAPTAATPSFTFAGDSLTLNNTNGTGGGLLFKGVGNASIVTFKNLILGGGLIRHASGAGDLFQLGGKVTVSAPSTIHADQGSINILANVTGNSTLTIPASGSSSYVRMLSPNNTFTGSIVNASRFELTSTGNIDFKIGAPGINNAITGALALSTLLNGSFDIDLSAADSAPGSSWSLVTAANTTYGATFKVNGFDKSGTSWSNGTFKFNQANGLLTPVNAWATDGGGNWTTAANWTAGVPTAGDDVTFSSALTAPNAPATVILDANATVSRVTFDNANRYIIGGPTPGTLTLTGVAQVNTKIGSHEIAAPIAGAAGLTKTGVGTLTLSAANLYSGNTTIESGTLALAGAAAIPNSQRIEVKPGATLNVAALASGLHLAAGQTLVNNSDTTVAGNVIAAAGSTVSGTGTFSGNLTAQDGATIRVGGDVLSPLTPTLNQVAYVDATTGAGGNTTLADGSVFNPKAEGTTGADNDWEKRSLGSGASTIESGGEAVENAYEIKTTISGLNPLESYRVHALFWDPASTAEDWNIRAGFTSNSGANTLYSVADATAELGGATAAPAATTLSFRSAPTTLSEGGRTMLAANLGTRTADANGKIEVYLDDLPPSVAANRRTLYDGLGVAQLNYVTMSVLGDYTQNAGATIVMDALGAGNHDQLIVGGTFTAGGTLKLVLDAGYIPLAAGDNIDLFDFASAAGSFNSFDLPALGGSLLWNVSKLTSTGELQVVVDVDADNDGQITGNDLLFLQRDDPTLVPAWQAQFGTQVVAGATGVLAAVPEPAAASLLAVASIALVARRPRSQQRTCRALT